MGISVTVLRKILILIVQSVLTLSLMTFQAAKSQANDIVAVIDADGAPVIQYTQSHALVIGVSNYSSGWRDLRNVPADIEEVSRSLKESGFGVSTILDPTGDELEDAIEDFLYDYDDPDARLLIYFAGHGHTILYPDGPRGFLVTHDTPKIEIGSVKEKQQKRDFRRNAISMNDIMGHARDIAAKHVLFAFDACFAGSVFEAVGRTDVPDLAIREEFDNRVRYFITSGDETQQVPDYSLFRRSFVEAFDGYGDSNGDTYITGPELGNFIYDSVKNKSSLSRPQTPQHGPAEGTLGGNFVFIVDPRKIQAAKATLDSHEVGDAIRDCDACPLVKVVPSGQFIMGGGAFKAAQPTRTVTLEKKFAIGETEVTFEQWDACVEDGGCAGYLPDDEGWGRGDRPVINVSKVDANRYVSWLIKKTGRLYRLPTEAEWEYVARAGRAGQEFWDEGVDRCQYANLIDPLNPDGLTCADGADRTIPVGALKPNNFGLYDVLGNVDEWVDDCWSPNHIDAPVDGRKRDDGDCTSAVKKGGSWKDHYRFVGFAKRDRDTYQSRIKFGGFRVVRDVAQ